MFAKISARNRKYSTTRVAFTKTEQESPDRSILETFFPGKKLFNVSTKISNYSSQEEINGRNILKNLFTPTHSCATFPNGEQLNVKINFQQIVLILKLKQFMQCFIYRNEGG